MAINPFEPPRTRDLDADPAGGTGRPVSAEAITELVRSAPWVRAAVWLTVISIAFALVNVALSIAGPRTPTTGRGPIAVQLSAIVLPIIILIIYLAYHRGVQGLARGESGALAAVIDSQRKLLKTMGLITVLTISLVVVLAFIAGFLARRGGP